MSTKTLCPQPDLECDACIETFREEHPGVEVFVHTYHALCDCPWVAHPADDFTDEATVCVGCGEKRSLQGEFNRFMRGAAA